MDLAVAADV